MSNRATILALMVTSVLASGCASGARITPNLNLPANYRETTDAAGRAPASLDAWWVAFEDPALTALVEAALKASPDARSAKARVEEAFATRRALFNQAVLPTGQIVGNANRGYSEVDGFFIPGFSQSGDNRNENANFNVSWELDLFGRRRAAVKEINAELAAVRFEAEAARASLAANVAQSYVQLHALNVQLDNARQIARVLSCDHKEKLVQRIGDVVHRHLFFCHRFEHRRLHLGRGPVDFVGQQDMGEDWPRTELEPARRRIEDTHAGDITGQQVRGELDPAEGRNMGPVRIINRLSKRFG